MSRRWSFRTRFVLAATICLLPLLVSLFYVMQQSLEQSRDTTIKNEVAIGNVIAKGVAQTLDENVSVLVDIASIESVRSLDLPAANDVLIQFKRARPSLYGVMLVTPDLKVAASAGGVDPAPIIESMQAQLTTVLTVGETGITGLVPLPGADGTAAAVGLIVPVLADPTAAQSGMPVAAMVGLLSVDRLSRTFVPAFGFAETDTIAAVVDDGNVIVSQVNAEQANEAMVTDLSEPIAAAVAGQRSNLSYTDANGEERLAVFAPIEFASADWAVVISNPAPTVTGTSSDFVMQALTALLIAVVITLALAFVLGEIVSRPVRRLTGQATAIAHGDYTQQVEPGGSGEFEALSVAVGEMAGRLTTHVRDLDAARIEVAAQAERLRDLLRRTVRLQEDERRRIAGDIHDAVSPLITGALYQTRAYQLGSAASSGEPGEGANSADLDAVTDLLERSMEELHAVIFALRPPDLDDLGVEAAIERYVQQIDRNGLPSRFDVIGDPRRLSPEARLAIYRIVQEALHNSLRHAHADEAVVRMEWTDDLLRVTIRDNGSGFDPENTSNATSLGLLSMRERAASIGAQLLIASQPGDGTVVVIERPHSHSVTVENGEVAADPAPEPGVSGVMALGASGR